MKEYKIVIEEMLDSLLEQKKFKTIKDMLQTMNPADIALLFEDIDDEQKVVLFRLLSKDLAADTFAEMDPDFQEILIRSFSDNELREVMRELYIDDAVDLVEEMPASVVKRILSKTDPDIRKEINELLKYPEDSAGSIMTTEYITLSPDMSVGEAFQRIRNTALDKETVYTLYVTKQRKLIGFLSLKDLLLVHDDKTLIGDIMNTNFISVNTHDDSEEVAQKLKKYNFIAMPVVDNEDRIVGIITFDDAMDVIEEETTEDIEIMGGMTPSGSKTYLRSTVFELFKHRIPWLMLLMISATFTGMIINYFESALAAQVVLTAFIPMLMDTGGNSGSQSSVIIIRAISLDEVEFSDLPAVIWKEIRTAVLCGAALAVVCFGKLMLIDRMLLGNENVTTTVALVVCATMAITVLIAKIIGCTLPLCARKVGFDPAVMASPFITTIVDAMSLLVFFSIATTML